MNFKTHENNIKFLSKKRNEITGLLRGACSDALKTLQADKYGNFDKEDLLSLYESMFGDNPSPCVDLAVFCSECAKAYPISPLKLLEGLEQDSISPEHVQIAYLKNAFADKAYRKVSQLLDKVSAVYLPGFREVCEEVYYGRSTYALMPIFSSSDGQLSSFRQLIAKYDLNIIFAVDISMSDEGFMRYALLRKGLQDSNFDNEISYLDISVVAENNFKFGDLLESCEFLGATASSVNSYPSEYSENSSIVYLTLDISNAEVAALCLFLEASHIRYNPIGAYNVK